MLVYHYDQNGIYTGMSTVTPSPLEPGRYLVPARAVEMEPPQAGLNQWPVWNGQNWELEPNFRGRTGYKTDTGEEVKIKAVGPWPADLSPDPKPGEAYVWDNQAGQWLYSLELDSPGSDYQFRDGAWIKTRFTKKEFLLLCGLPQVVKLNQAINGGNVLAKSVHDLLMSSDYIDLTDPDTEAMLQLLTTAEGGEIMTGAQADEILKGLAYVAEA